jgi:hypothetical protein
MSTNRKSQILYRFAFYCPPLEDKLFETLPVDPDVHCVQDPQAVLGSLRAEFTDDELASAGLIGPAPDSSLGLTPLLASPCTPFIVLNDWVTKTPYDIITSCGSLSGELPLLAMARDSFTRQRLMGGEGSLFVTFAWQDLVVLRACGIAAGLGVGLDSLQLPDVVALCRAFNIDLDDDSALSEVDLQESNQRSDGVGQDGEGGDAEHFYDDFDDAGEQETEYEVERMSARAYAEESQRAAAEAAAARGEQPSSGERPLYGPLPPRPKPVDFLRPNVVLVGWGVAQLRRVLPDAMKRTLETLSHLKKQLGLDLSQVHGWQPAFLTIERLQYFLSQGNGRLFARLLRRSREEANSLVSDERPAGAMVPVANYPAAVGRLEKAVIERGDLRQWQAAWQQAQADLAQQVINPIRQLAAESPDPLRRLVVASLAEFGQNVLMQTMLINESLRREVQARGPTDLPALPSDAIKTVMGTAGRMLDFVKTVQKEDDAACVNLLARYQAQETPRRLLG